ncbi:MAG: CBS domain-containing protein [Pseudomonas sp.]
MFRSIKVRDYMDREAVTLTPDTHLFKAIDILLEHRISGAPVVDARGKLVGVLSESDCLQGILSGAYFEESCGTVASLMSSVVETIEADADILKAAEHFVARARRRLPVIEEGRLVGQISRRDILQALKTYNDHGAPKRR